MSGQHSQPDQWGRKTDAGGDVISVSGTLEDPNKERPYIPAKELK